MGFKHFLMFTKMLCILAGGRKLSFQYYLLEMATPKVNVLPFNDPL